METCLEEIECQEVKMDGSNPCAFFKELKLYRKIEVCLTDNFVRKYVSLLPDVPVDEQEKIILEIIGDGTIYGDNHENGRENTFLIEKEIPARNITLGLPLAVYENSLVLITAKNAPRDEEYCGSKNVFQIESPYKDRELRIRNIEILDGFNGLLEKCFSNK